MDSFLLTVNAALATSGVQAAEASGTDVFWLVAFVLLALVFSFLCSISEAVLLSLSPSYVAGLRAKRPARAAQLKRLKEDNLDQSLAAILTVNTIAHTLGAIGAGAKATLVFGDAWFGVFSAVMTLLILFLSEIVPKTLGARYWRQLSGFTAWYVLWLVRSMYPLILVSQKLTRWLTGERKGAEFSREEFVAMADVGQELGHLDDRESKIIRNLLLFRQVNTEAIMTPRVVISALQQDLTVDEALSARGKATFSRMPVYEEDLDSITGFVLLEDLLVARNEGKADQPIREWRREIVAVPFTMKLSRLLETLLTERQHIALVVGEYGDTEGLVSLEDVVETLLGIEILDEGDRVADMQQLARQMWRRRARRLGIELDDDG